MLGGGKQEEEHTGKDHESKDEGCEGAEDQVNANKETEEERGQLRIKGDENDDGILDCK